MRSIRLVVALLCAIPVFAVGPAGASDLTIEFKEVQGGKTTTSTQYLSADRMRSSSGDTDTIVEFDAGRIVNIDHKKKQYSEITVDELEKMMEAMNAQMAAASAQMEEAMKNVPPAMRDKMKGMMGGVGGDGAEVTVTPGGQREVAGYPTRQYTIRMGDTLQMEQWTTTALELPMKPGSFARMARFTNPLLSNPMLKGFGQLAEKMREIEGYTLAQTTRTSMMGHTVESSREAVAVRSGEIPASTFAIPQGYKKVPSPFEKMKGR